MRRRTFLSSSVAAGLIGSGHEAIARTPNLAISPRELW